jgi:Glycosyl hydrolase catalytic core
MRGTIFAVLAAVVLCAQVEAAVAQPPPRFFGVTGNGPLDGAGVDLVQEASLMRSSGVRTLRLTIEWPYLQPYADFADVPPAELARFVDVDGIPTDFAATDARIKAAAINDLEVLALVLRSPNWAAKEPGEYLSVPRDPRAYGRFLSVLVGRYGPEGSFWAENPLVPRRPLRHFQIWNEPNLKHFFPVAKWVPTYVALLRASYKAIKAADPGATVVTAGMPNFVWSDYEKLFKAGMRAQGYFDVIAVHPYTDNPAGCITVLGRVRRVLDSHGARQRPIWVTETGWPSARGKAKVLPQHRNWITSQSGEAARVDGAYRAYAANAKRLKLERAYWYTWISRDRGSTDAWEYAGLRTVDRNGRFVDKPALAAFRNVVRSLTKTSR